MSELSRAGIDIRDDGDRVVVEVPGGRWEGSAAEAERLLTHLHYVLGRARPGTNIVSVFVNDALWGGKTIQPDPEAALEDVKQLVDDLSARVDKLIAERREARGEARTEG